MVSIVGVFESQRKEFVFWYNEYVGSLNGVYRSYMTTKGQREEMLAASRVTRLCAAELVEW